MKLVENRWMFVPVALLALTVTVATVTVLSAVVGHPLGTEPNYDAKAASWNAEREQRALNERLRWVVTPEIESSGTRRTIALRIEDKHAARIDAGAVRIECIPIRAAESRQLIELSRRERGDFVGSFDSAIGGQWEFRVTVTKSEIRYTDSFRRFLAGASEAVSRG